VGAGPVWERALPANFFFTAWLTHHPRRGGLRSAADPHPSWVPSFRQEPRSPGSLGAGLLCRFADPPPRGRWVRLTFCATFAGRAFMPTGTLPQEWAHSHTALWQPTCPTRAQCQAPTRRPPVQRHKRPAPSEQKDPGLFVKRGHRGPVRVSRRAEPASPGALAEPPTEKEVRGQGPLPQAGLLPQAGPTPTGRARSYRQGLLL